MDLWKQKLLMEPSLVITECIKKENKPLQTRLQVSSLGQEDFYIELNWTITNNYKIFVSVYKDL